MVAIHPMRIPGVWRQGYVLDYHTLRSELIGYDEYGNPLFDTRRTEMGELLYQLKYKRNLDALDALGKAATTFVKSWKVTLDAIVPVPPTKHRRVQPVFAIAARIANALRISFRQDFVRNDRNAKELKNVFDFNERIALLENAYRVRDQSLHSKVVLLFDDLYRSGATLNAVTRVLYEQAGCATVYALALTRTRTIS